MLYDLNYLFNGISLMFFMMAAYHAGQLARNGRSRPHILFTLCLLWMCFIEIKEFFLSYDPGYHVEVLAPGYTFTDILTLPLLSFFFFELVMPGRITVKYALRLLSPFLLLIAAYAVGLPFCPRRIYLSFAELLSNIPSYLPTVLLLYVLYGAGYCIFALTRIVLYSLRYAKEIAQAYSFTECIHLQWLRGMPAVLAVYLLSYILIIMFTSSPAYTLIIYLMSLAVWGTLYGCIMQYRIPKIIQNYWKQPRPAQTEHETSEEESGRTAWLRQQVAEAIDERRLYLNPSLTIIDMATECGTNRTHLSQFFNNELKVSFRDYINRCRVDHAAALLAETKEKGYKIEEVGLLSGFGSSSTFFRAFGKEKGMTPQQWVERLPGAVQPRGGETADDNGSPKADSSSAKFQSAI